MNADDLAASEVLLLDDTHCLRDQVLQLCRSKQKSTERRLKIKSGGLQTLIEYIRVNQGYTLLPRLAAELLSAREQANNVRHFEKPLPVRKVSLVFRGARLKRSLIEAVKTSVLDAVGDRVIPTSTKSGVRILSPNPDHFEI